MTQNQTKGNIDASSFYLTEYSDLREEIVKRISFQHQLIAMTLLAAGTFLPWDHKIILIHGYCLPSPY